MNVDFDNDLRQAVDALRRGGVILYPTDTIWGIGCDATNHRAVQRVFEIKRRSDSKAMISLVDSVERLERFVDDVPPVAIELIEAAVHPVSIIFDHPYALAPNLLADDGSAALRITAERFSNELCRRFGKPVVSTSANISGHPSPASFTAIDPEIIEAVDYVVQYRRSDSAPATASSVIKISSDSSFKIIRP